MLSSIKKKCFLITLLLFCFSTSVLAGKNTSIRFTNGQASIGCPPTCTDTGVFGPHDFGKVFQIYFPNGTTWQFTYNKANTFINGMSLVKKEHLMGKDDVGVFTSQAGVIFSDNDCSEGCPFTWVNALESANHWVSIVVKSSHHISIISAHPIETPTQPIGVTEEKPTLSAQDINGNTLNLKYENALDITVSGMYMPFSKDDKMHKQVSFSGKFRKFEPHNQEGISVYVSHGKSTESDNIPNSDAILYRNNDNKIVLIAVDKKEGGVFMEK
ncbi:MAG: hypothetical protein QM528_05210 [Phycisphaerales bacterium]|nr:hypothetical protein [Phycisphaerales bacterium]